MNHYKLIPQLSSKVLSAATCIALLSACDPGPDPELDSELEDQLADADWIDLDAPIASADEPQESAPILAEVEMGDGKIIFYDESSVRDGVEDVVVGIGFTGVATLGAVVAFDEQGATALEIFRAVAPDAQVPEVLQREHELRVEAGEAEAQPRDFSDIKMPRESHQKYCSSWSVWMSAIWPAEYTWTEWTTGYMPSGQSQASDAYTVSALYFYSGYSTARALGGCNHGLNSGPAGKFQIHYRADANDPWHSVAYWDLAFNEGYFYRSSGAPTRQYRGWVYHTGGESTNWYVNAAW